MKEVMTTDWNGYLIEVAYQPDWLNMARHVGERCAHLEVRCVKPAKAPLPITETGYRSHFTSPDCVEEHGGPVSFVKIWLDSESQSAKWKELELSNRQGELF